MESLSDRVGRFLDASYTAGWEFSDEEFEIDSDVSDFDLNTEYTGGVEDYEDFETGLHLLHLDFKVKGSGLDSMGGKVQSTDESPESKRIHLTLNIYDEKESELDSIIKLKKDEDAVFSTFLKPTFINLESTDTIEQQNQPIISSRIQNIFMDDVSNMSSLLADTESLSPLLTASETHGSGVSSRKTSKITTTKDRKSLTVIDFEQFNEILRGYLNNLNNLNIRFQ